jgi:heterotetrameric sarcosine oxidase gamma subunit
VSKAIKQSALFHKHQEMKALMTEHHGWLVPARYAPAEAEAAQVRERAGLADVSWMERLELDGYGLNAPPAFGQGVRSWTLAPNHLLVTFDPHAREGVMETLSSFRATASHLALPAPVYWTEMTSILAQLLLAGPRSRDVLGKLTSLNLSEPTLPNLGCAQTSLAHIHALVLRDDLGSLPAFHLLVSREYAESVWEALLHAGHEFQLGAFGLEAQALLMSLA